MLGAHDFVFRTGVERDQGPKYILALSRGSRADLAQHAEEDGTLSVSKSLFASCCPTLDFRDQGKYVIIKDMLCTCALLPYYLTDETLGQLLVSCIVQILIGVRHRQSSLYPLSERAFGVLNETETWPYDM